MTHTSVQIAVVLFLGLIIYGSASGITAEDKTAKFVSDVHNIDNLSAGESNVKNSQLTSTEDMSPIIPTFHQITRESSTENVGGKGRAPTTLISLSSKQFAFVHCESIHFRRRTCHFPHVIVGLVYAKQISKSPCIQGQSYFIGHRTITVDHGCRAYFLLNTLPNSPPPPSYTDINCSSWHFRPAQCHVAHPVRRITKLHQYSKSPCTELRTYHMIHRGIGVNSGCRGRFRLYH